MEPGRALDASWAAPGSKTSPRRFQTLPGCLLGGSWAALGRKTWPTWLQLGSQNGAKMVQKSINISIIFWMPLGIDFSTVFNRFLEPTWRQIETNIDQKSLPTSKGDFSQKHQFSLGKTMILKVLGVEVGCKNRSKIDQTMESKKEWLLASIFMVF